MNVAVIPAYNEASRIAAVVRGAQPYVEAIVDRKEILLGLSHQQLPRSASSCVTRLQLHDAQPRTLGKAGVTAELSVCSPIEFV